MPGPMLMLVCDVLACLSDTVCPSASISVCDERLLHAECPASYLWSSQECTQQDRQWIGHNNSAFFQGAVATALAVKWLSSSSWRTAPWVPVVQMWRALLISLKYGTVFHLMLRGYSHKPLVWLKNSTTSHLLLWQVVHKMNCRWQCACTCAATSHDGLKIVLLITCFCDEVFYKMNCKWHCACKCAATGHGLSLQWYWQSLAFVACFSQDELQVALLLHMCGCSVICISIDRNVQVTLFDHCLS